MDAGGIRTRCIEAGTGDPLIMLHGAGGHAEAYSRNVVPLSKDFHVYAVDMVGHGFTDYHPTLFGPDAMADHLVRFMDAERIQGAFFAGESMGGAASVRLALSHSDRVKKLAFVTGAGLQMGPEADKLAEPGREALRRLSAAATGNPTPETIRERLMIAALIATSTTVSAVLLPRFGPRKARGVAGQATSRLRRSARSKPRSFSYGRTTTRRCPTRWLRWPTKRCPARSTT